MGDKTGWWDTPHQSNKAVLQTRLEYSRRELAMSLKLYDRILIAEGEVYPYAIWLYFANVIITGLKLAPREDEK